MTKCSSWYADTPPWKSFDRECTRRSWLEYIDACLDHLFQEEQAEAALESDESNQLFSEKQTPPKRISDRLSDNERNALLAGMTLDTGGNWKALAEVIRAGNTSIELNEILAELIEFGGFHPHANFNEAVTWHDSEFNIYGHFIWVCELLRKLYPEQNSRAILARAKQTVAHFMVDNDSGISLAEAKRSVSAVATGLNSRLGGGRFRLLRARLEKPDQFMLGRCRVYRR